jgi:hypothetical protein
MRDEKPSKRLEDLSHYEIEKDQCHGICDMTFVDCLKKLPDELAFSKDIPSSEVNGEQSDRSDLVKSVIPSSKTHSKLNP